MIHDKHTETCEDHTRDCQVTYRVGDVIDGREILAIHYQKSARLNSDGSPRWNGLALLSDDSVMEYSTVTVTPNGMLDNPLRTSDVTLAELVYLDRLRTLVTG